MCSIITVSSFINVNPAYFNCMNIFFDISNVEISASMVFFCVNHKNKIKKIFQQWLEKIRKTRSILHTLSSLAVRTLAGTVSSYSGCDSILTIFCRLRRARSNFFSHLLISFSRSTRPFTKKLFSKSFEIKNKNMCLTLTSV